MQYPACSSMFICWWAKLEVGLILITTLMGDFFIVSFIFQPITVKEMSMEQHIPNQNESKNLNINISLNKLGLQVTSSILFFFFRIKSMLNLTLVPLKSPDLTTGVPVCSFPMPDILFKLSFIYLSISPGESTPPIFQVIKILSFKHISISTFEVSFSLPLPLDKAPFILTPILPLVNSFSMKLSLIKVARIDISIYKCFNSITLLDTFLNFSFVKKAFFGHYNSLPCFLPIHKVSDILCTLFINVFPCTMRFTIWPFSFISHELFSIIR